MGRKQRRGAPATYERRLWAMGYSLVAGVDEAGRGAWAGPLVAAAVIMPPSPRVRGVTDSKLLAPAKRERLYDEIVATALAWAVGVVQPEEIDHINIGRAVAEAMNRALAALDPQPEFVLLDGRDIASIAFPHSAVTDGDARCYSIAAASIVAKVWRDRLMCRLHEEFPQYGFANHKGYGTAQHQAALRRHGPCRYHRFSFEPIRRLGQPRLVDEPAGD